MSDIMLFGVLRMPYEMAMQDEMSRRQFHSRAQDAADRIEAMQAALDAAEADTRRAVEAERETCARIAETARHISTVVGRPQLRDVPATGAQIASVIRAQGDGE